MTREQQEAARARCEETTPGRWIPVPENHLEIQTADGEYLIGSVHAMEDVPFICHARTDLPAALDELERIRHAVHDKAKQWCLHECANDDSGLYHCHRRCGCDFHTWARELLGEDERQCGTDCEYCARLDTRCADCAEGDCGACNVRAHGCLCQCEDCGCGDKPLTPDEQAELLQAHQVLPLAKEFNP